MDSAALQQHGVNNNCRMLVLSATHLYHSAMDCPETLPPQLAMEVLQAAAQLACRQDAVLSDLRTTSRPVPSSARRQSQAAVGELADTYLTLLHRKVDTMCAHLTSEVCRQLLAAAAAERLAALTASLTQQGIAAVAAGRRDAVSCGEGGTAVRRAVIISLRRLLAAPYGTLAAADHAALLAVLVQVASHCKDGCVLTVEQWCDLIINRRWTSDVHRRRRRGPH